MLLMCSLTLVLAWLDPRLKS
ncbi:hypothetical protein DMI70_21190 [Escherichia coli]|nr:hypothetical protein [Escherichia coli]